MNDRMKKDSVLGLKTMLLVANGALYNTLNEQPNECGD